ncbi:Aquaporin-3 [Erysiphe necator]|nr:Aquaporin-3 [Erysiphe necator]
MSSAPIQRERRRSFGPTIYHEDLESASMARPPPVFFDEVIRDRPRRSSSVNSRSNPARRGSVRYYQDPANMSSPIQSPVKPGFVETVEREIRSDEKEFEERAYEDKDQYVEKPFGQDDQPFYENTYNTRTPVHKPGNQLVASYKPPKLGKPQDPKRYWWTSVRNTLREPFSEFFGTFILVLFGDGSIAQTVLSNGTRGTWQSICWGWGIGVMLGVYVAGISGANLNPAVTLSNCIFRKHPWQKLPVYALGQTLGAFAAAGVVYANYYAAINAYEGAGVRTVPGALNSVNTTAGIFATYPAPFVNKTQEFFSEFIASAILMFCVYALQDKFNRGADKFVPLALFFVLYGIGACFGWETGFAINPARDFGPRLLTYFVGYGNDVWTVSGHYFWVPLIAPCFGCVFGGWIYDLFIFQGESPVNTPWMGLKRLVGGSVQRNDSNV